MTTNWDGFVNPEGATPAPFDPSQGSLFEQTQADTHETFAQFGLPVPDVPSGPFDPSQGSLFEQTQAATHETFAEFGLPVPDVPSGPFDPSQGSLYDQTKADTEETMQRFGLVADDDARDADDEVDASADGADVVVIDGSGVDLDDSAHDAAWAELTEPAEVSVNIHVTVEVVDAEDGAAIDELDVDDEFDTDDDAEHGDDAGDADDVASGFFDDLGDDS